VKKIAVFVEINFDCTVYTLRGIWLYQHVKHWNYTGWGGASG